MDFICSGNCCNCEVCWIVFNFWVDISSTCCTCALFIFSNSCILRICVSQRAFSFRNNSSCNLVGSPRDSTNSFRTSCNAVSCASVLFYKSLMHFLSDSTWISLLARFVLARFNKWSLLPSKRVSLKFDTLAFPNTEHHVWFHRSLRFGENNAAGLPEALILWQVRRLCTYLSFLADHCSRSPGSSLGMQLWSQQLFLNLSVFEIRVRRNDFNGLVKSASGTGGRTCPQLVTCPSSRDRVSYVPEFVQILSFLP